MAAAAAESFPRGPRRLPGGPAVIALFGTNAVGKSTLAAAIADRLERAALLEVDVLRYQRRGGLVATSRGTPPRLAPQEYEAQCAHAVELALLQARSYLAQGVSVCIEGLEDGCVPGSPWAEQAWLGLCVHHLLLRVDPAVLAERWAGRGRPLTAEVLAHQAWFEARARSFALVVDGAGQPPESLADAVIDHLEWRGRDHAG